MSSPTPGRPAADRNLLFGILALQMDFISRDDLIRAMNAWALEKSKPLGQILREQGALGSEEHALLEALTKKHLEKHANDAERSLAALSSVTSVRQDLQEKVADPDVQASLACVTATPPPAGDDYATRTPTVGTPTSAGTRFRVLRPHARGGLGEVFVAEDQELGREVALKEIQGKHADHPDSRARFLLEAEVTGLLEHPGIVPVYGLGTYADGRPYYAMRFIQGDSLKEALERFHRSGGVGSTAERTLEFRKLLGRFVDVCNAIAYAHSKGVLHRDLKPGNIMLGQYGETLVVDWGLAKPLALPEVGSGRRRSSIVASLSDSATPTVMGQAIGTPQFMSPEQAAGQLDRLGPASDVYSLGATLYQILTGRPAFTDSDVGEVLRKVQRGDFPPPRQVKPAVPAALDAVCRKAMALRPSDRYPTARALADDVEHWLADEPVTAYRDPLLARLARWARRHRPLVAAAAALLVTAVAALAVSTVLISREQARTEAQRRLADANFQTALRAVNDMLTEVAEEQLVYEPRMEEKRRRLLEEAEHYYEAFLEQKGNDVALRKETALASKRVGDIARLLSKRDQAATAYGSAIEQFKGLAAAHADDPDYRFHEAECYNFVGEVLRPIDPARAEDNYRQAADLFEQLRAQFPDRPEYRKELANTRDNLGLLFHETRRLPESEKSFREAIALLEGLIQAGGDTRDSRHLLARVYLNLGPVLRAADRPAEAEKGYREGIRLQKELVRDHDEVPDYRYELGVSENNLGILLEQQHRYDEADAVYGEALARFDRLVTEFPGIPDYWKQRANTQSNRAIIRARHKQWAEAEAAWKESLAGYDRLLARSPKDPEYRGGRGKTLSNLGWCRLQQNDPRQARQYLEEAITEVRAALTSNARDPFYLRTLRNSYDYLADALLRQGEHAEAARAASLLVAVFGNDPKDHYQAALVLAQCARLAEKDPAAARRYAERAVEELRQAVAAGFRDAARLDEGPFQALEKRDDFRKLRAELKGGKPAAAP
jgi:serine/threonine-protein kinase